MITIRKSGDRGHFDFGWLNTRHTFSFGDYIDRNHMSFRALRVINEDHIAPGAGFPQHPHSDMEIISYMVAGSLAHKDSMGNTAVISPGEIQRMSAGSGILHSEFNASKTEPAHLIQIWLKPAKKGIEPGYEQKPLPPLPQRRNTLALIASPQGGADGSNAVSINQDVRLYSGVLDAGAKVELELGPDRHAWLQLIKGEVELSGQTLRAGDGAAVSEEKRLEIRVGADAELLVFDLA
jgi:quercetin 2,3-dioxygenase